MNSQESGFLKAINEEHSRFYGGELGKGALRDLQQVYPRPWLYVADFLQNTVDVNAKRIRLKLDEDESQLIFEHEGSEFNDNDVKVLYARGVSIKGVGTVGFVGIGFKAVFHGKETILEINDDMALVIAENAATEVADSPPPFVCYQTRLDPPTGSPTDDQGNFIPMSQWNPANWSVHIHRLRKEE